MNQSPSDEIANVYRQACLQYQDSCTDAAQLFVERVSDLLNSALSNHARFAALLRIARNYDIVDSFSHLPIQQAHA